MAKPFKVGDIIRGVELLELDEVRSTKKEKYWKTKCPQCGEIQSVRSGKIGQLCKSCASKHNRQCRQISCITDDLTGKTFGYWKVLHKTNKSNFWHCKCQNCGTERDVFRGSLTSGDSKSCGCINSWGEEYIIQLLEELNIKYKRQISFEDLRSKKNYKLFFDFGIYDKNDNLICLIEFDGQQHYSYHNDWYRTIDEFHDAQERDNLKNKYCDKKQIKLFRLNKESNLREEIQKIKYLMGGS